MREVASHASVGESLICNWYLGKVFTAKEAISAIQRVIYGETGPRKKQLGSLRVGKRLLQRRLPHRLPHCLNFSAIYIPNYFQKTDCCPSYLSYIQKSFRVYFI